MGSKSRTECSVIIKATLDWFTNSSESIESFSTIHLIPALERQGMMEVNREEVESSTDNYMRWRRSVSMRVGRIIRGDQPFPMAWKWVWINLLPEQYQLEVRRELMAMAGSLYVPVPRFTAVGDQPSRAKAHLHRLSQEFGEFLQHCQPAHNGYYDINDCPAQVDRMLKEAADLVEAVLSEAMALSRGTGRQLPRFSMIAIKAES